ncbi:MAG: hypothetical protein HY205_01470 [Nitrospirae bacterium]|nr:hypothetical protein [Nitrospirota bacterium]
MDIEIGSNLYRNTDGTVEIEGVPQIALTLKTPQGPLLVNFVLFDEGGRVTVKVVDGTLAFNERRAYELTKTTTSLLLKNTETGKVALQVELKESSLVVFKQGTFLTMKGHRFDISPTEWHVGKHRMSGKEIDTQGKAAAIG